MCYENWRSSLTTTYFLFMLLIPLFYISSTFETFILFFGLYLLLFLRSVLIRGNAFYVSIYNNCSNRNYSIEQWSWILLSGQAILMSIVLPCGRMRKEILSVNEKNCFMLDFIWGYFASDFTFEDHWVTVILWRKNR